MYIEPELLTEYEELKEKHPNIAEDIIMDYFSGMAEQAKITLEEYKNKKEGYGCHIVSQKQYDYYIKKLPSVKWTVDEVVKASGIDFTDKPYYEYDFAFLMNFKYYKYSSFISETSYYIKMVKSDLECKLVYKSDDMAYHIAKNLK